MPRERPVVARKSAVWPEPISATGEPSNANLEEAMGGGEREAPVIANSIDMPEAVSGSSGGAVGGTPANKRSTASPPRSRSKRKSK